MDLKKLKFLSILLAVLGSFALVGCGNDTSVASDSSMTCGAGTMLVEDTYVGESGPTCGASTMVSADGLADTRPR